MRKLNPSEPLYALFKTVEDKTRFFSALPYALKFLINVLILALLLTSCASRRIQRSYTTTDSTTSTTSHVQAADINKTTAVTTTTVSDQSGQRVVFQAVDTPIRDSWVYHDTSMLTSKSIRIGGGSTVTFENGRIKSASGNILEATATSTRLQEQNDSLYTENMILKDSLQTAMSAKHVETVTVEKVLKRTPIGWWLLALVVGFIGGVYCQYKKPLI